MLKLAFKDVKIAFKDVLVLKITRNWKYSQTTSMASKSI